MDKVFIDGLSFAMPLFIMAIGAIYSEKSGVTNLAVEGFQGFGAFIGALVAVILMPSMGSGARLESNWKPWSRTSFQKDSAEPRRLHSGARKPWISAPERSESRALPSWMNARKPA